MGILDFSQKACRSQICQQGLAVGGEEDVTGRDITVHSALTVQIGQCMRQRNQDGHRLADAEAAAYRDEGGQ